jgi:hypothetical protein
VRDCGLKTRVMLANGRKVFASDHMAVEAEFSF